MIIRKKESRVRWKRGGFLIVLVLSALGNSCKKGSRPLPVAQITEPEYPFDARLKRVEGTVDVVVCIGVDGRVLSAAGSGTSSVLNKAAEENAKTWTFGPLPAAHAYPTCQDVRYVYKLNGKPKFVVIPPTVETDLPNSIEIVAIPVASDYNDLKLYPLPKRSQPAREPKK